MAIIASNPTAKNSPKKNPLLTMTGFTKKNYYNFAPPRQILFIFHQPIFDRFFFLL
jgi:hypothetical protein